MAELPTIREPWNCIHKSLDEIEEIEFRTWARENYKRFESINGTWHPVVQHECVLINAGVVLRGERRE